MRDAVDDPNEAAHDGAQRGGDDAGGDDAVTRLVSAWDTLITDKCDAPLKVTVECDRRTFSVSVVLGDAAVDVVRGDSAEQAARTALSNLAARCATVVGIAADRSVGEVGDGTRGTRVGKRARRA